MPFDIPYFGELIAFCTTISWSIGIFPFTEASRRLGPNPVNHFRIVVAVLFLSLSAIIFTNINFDQLLFEPNSHQWIWLGASGAIGLALGDYFGFTTYSILGARVGSIFSTLAPGAALITGYFLVDERINFIGIIGMLISISGIIWLTLSKHEPILNNHNEHGKPFIGILFGILSAICQGIGLVFAKKGLVDGALNPIHASWIRMVIATGCIYLVSIVTGKLGHNLKPIFQNKNKGNIYALGGTIFGPVIGVSLSMYAVKLINTSVAQTIFSIMPVTVLPIAWIFHREKITWQTLLASVIAIIGVVVLIWRDLLYSNINF